MPSTPVEAGGAPYLLGVQRRDRGGRDPRGRGEVPRAWHCGTSGEDGGRLWRRAVHRVRGGFGRRRFWRQEDESGRHRGCQETGVRARRAVVGAGPGVLWRLRLGPRCWARFLPACLSYRAPSLPGCWCSLNEQALRGSLTPKLQGARAPWAIAERGDLRASLSRQKFKNPRWFSWVEFPGLCPEYSVFTVAQRAPDLFSENT